MFQCMPQIIYTKTHLFSKLPRYEEGFSVCPRLHTLKTMYLPNYHDTRNVLAMSQTAHPIIRIFINQQDVKKVLVYVPDCIPDKSHIHKPAPLTVK